MPKTPDGGWILDDSEVEEPIYGTEPARSAKVTPLRRAQKYRLKAVAPKMRSAKVSPPKRGPKQRLVLRKHGDPSRANYDEQHPGGESGASAERAAREDKAKEIMRLAREREPAITAAVVNIANTIAEKHGGEMVGIDYALKTNKDRIVEKLEEGASKHPHGGYTGEIKDAVRYTLTLPVENYTEGAQEVLRELGEGPFDVVQVKNYWEPGDDYDGINAVLKHVETGQLVEYQIHTPETWDIKDKKTHEIYTQARTETDPVKAKELVDSMKTFWEKVARPAGVMVIGTITSSIAGIVKGDQLRFLILGEPGKPSGLMAVRETSKAFWLHYLDADGKWVHDPTLLDYLSGNNADAEPTTPQEAKRLVEGWGFTWAEPPTS